jgi:hypothetical protein
MNKTKAKARLLLSTRPAETGLKNDEGKNTRSRKESCSDSSLAASQRIEFSEATPFWDERLLARRVPARQLRL